MSSIEIVVGLDQGADPINAVTGRPTLGGHCAIDVTNFDPNLSIFGETVVGTRTHDINVAFNYNLSAFDVNVATSGTGAAIFDQNTLKINSGTGVASSVTTSKDTVTYRPGSEAFGMFTMGLEGGGEAGLDQYIGLVDATDGFAIGYNGTNFSTLIRKSGVDTWTAQADFVGKDIAWLDPTKLNIYLIRYGYLGIAPITYWVFHGPTLSWRLIHCLDLTNKQSLPHISAPILPISASSVRASGTGTDLTMRTASWRAGILNSGTEPASRHFSFPNTKNITTTLTNIFTLQSKATYQSQVNKIAAIIENISCAADGTKPVQLSVFRNATLGGTPAFADINLAESIMEVDTAGTTVTGGDRIFTTGLGKTGNLIFDLLKYRYLWYPGNTITFAAQATLGTSDVTMSGNWGEIF